MVRSKNTTGRRAPINRRSALTRKSRFILPWPYVIFLFLCVGVLLVGWTFQAGADNLQVRAKVSAPLPSGPALITSPGDGTRFNSVPIIVAGTCPLDTYVQLYRNDVFSGTVICTTDGNFQLQTDLFPGANQLKVRVFNITDDEGPPSDPITVYYDVPQQPGSGGASGGGSPSGSGVSTSTPSVNTPPFLIKTTYTYQGYKVGQDIEWTFETSGGEPPYAINVDWGDGTYSLLSQKEAGKIKAYHRYKEAGSDTKSSFTIKVNGTDSAGHQAFLQLFLIVGPSSIPSIVARNIPSGPHINKHWLLLAWPAYLVLILMALSFWLGEREEIIELRRSNRMRNRRA
jgi:hypothetical protein